MYVEKYWNLCVYYNFGFYYLSWNIEYINFVDIFQSNKTRMKKAMKIMSVQAKEDNTWENKEEGYKEVQFQNRVRRLKR